MKNGSLSLNTNNHNQAIPPNDEINPSPLDALILSLRFLDHGSSNVRISAFSTLVSAVVASTHVDATIIQRLKECVPCFHQETNPKPRNEFISLMKKLCFKLARPRTPSTAGKQEIALSAFVKCTEVGNRTLETPSDFIEWYVVYMIREMRPTASYQSHITALKIFSELEMTLSLFDIGGKGTFFSGRWTKTTTLHQQLSRALLDLLFDPFDDVRQFSAAILDNLVHSEFCYRGVRGKVSMNNDSQTHRIIIHNILDCIPGAEALFRRTGRADHADGLGRLLNLAFTARRFSSILYDQASAYELIEYDLEQDIGIAIQDLELAVSSAPLHGHLIALRWTHHNLPPSFANSQHRYIINRHDIRSGPKSIATLAFSQKFPRLCGQIWSFVKPVLCSDAPEGQMLYDDLPDATDAEGKERLSFCWRALKESRYDQVRFLDGSLITEF